MNSSKPRVSVVIPNYNYGRFLRRRLRTVLDQTYDNFEVILLDDCSTDSSKEVIAEFADDPRIRCVYNETNSGSPFIQINKGVRMANGEFIWVAEADDYADLRLLERLVCVLDGNPSVGVAYCQSMQVDEDDNLLSLVHYRSTSDPDRWSRDFVANGIDECRKHLAFRNTIPNFSAVLFRKHVFDKIGGADESLKLCGDWITWIKMLMISDVAFMATPMNYYRQHSSAIRQKLSFPLQIKEAYFVFDFCKKSVGISDEDARDILGRLMRMWIRNCMWKGKVRQSGNITMIFNIARRSDPHFWVRFPWYLADVFVAGIAKNTRRAVHGARRRIKHRMPFA